MVLTAKEASNKRPRDQRGRRKKGSKHGNTLDQSRKVCFHFSLPSLQSIMRSQAGARRKGLVRKLPNKEASKQRQMEMWEVEMEICDEHGWPFHRLLRISSASSLVRKHFAPEIFQGKKPSKLPVIKPEKSHVRVWPGTRFCNVGIIKMRVFMPPQFKNCV